MENVTKLKNHFDQIETFRQDLLVQAEAEKATFADAKTKLEWLKVLNKTSQEELEKRVKFSKCIITNLFILKRFLVVNFKNEKYK